MELKNIVKKNGLAFVVIFLYIYTLVTKFEIGIVALKNSIYYFKELLSIMPIVLVLTALLDYWVPKRVIQNKLGNEAGIKGVFFSFLLGSISAGPIYAAFPICVMLSKKGASIKNIIIILSSWAVIKLPMLVNEVKFLGFKFMIIRWILTVLAIVIFSIIGAKIVKKKDIIVEKVDNEDILVINKRSCMGCSLCTKSYPLLFEMNNKKANVKEFNTHDIDLTKLKNTIYNCPTKAIRFNQ